MALNLNKPGLLDRVHYNNPPSGMSYGPPHHGYATGHVYSSIGHSSSGHSGSGHSGYGYESAHAHSYTPKGNNNKKSVALSALTLLAFLFFLHILQNCLEDQHNQTNNTTVVVMAARDQKEQKINVMKKRKGDTAEFDNTNDDDDYQEDNEYIETKTKSSGTIIRKNWNINKKNKDEDENDKRNVVTTRIKTFTKYDKIDFD